MWLPPLRIHRPAVWLNLPQQTTRQEQQSLYQWGSLAFCLRRDLWQPSVLASELLIYKESVLELRATPPLGLTLDLIALWKQGETWSPRSLEVEEQERSRLLLRLQNEIFYRLLRIPTFARLRRALLHLSDIPLSTASPVFVAPTPASTFSSSQHISLRDRALAMLLAEWFRSLRELLLDPFRPHDLPFLQGLQGSDPPMPFWWKSPHLAMQRFEISIQRPGWMEEYIHVLLDRVARLSDHELLQESWLSLLRHFEWISTPLDRLRWETITRAKDAIPAPQSLMTFFQSRDDGYQRMRVESRSAIPEGGRSGIARRGTFESLLPSELLFWEEGQEVDPFVIRWVEHELLFYEREQEILHTWQRRLQIALHLEWSEIHYKSPDLPTSTLAILFGFLARLLQDLREICPEEVLLLEIYLGPEGSWKNEAPLLHLFFSSLEGIGSFTSLQTLPSIPADLLSSPLSPGDVRLLVTSPATAAQYLGSSSSSPPYHALFCISPSKELLPPLLSLSPEIAVYPAEAIAQEGFLAPSSPRPASEIPLTPLLPQIILDLSAATPETTPVLAKLRDRLLSIILAVPPVSRSPYTSLAPAISPSSKPPSKPPSKPLSP